MSQHHVLRASPETCHWGFFDAGLKPVLTVASGDTVTMDCVSGGPDVLPEGRRLRHPAGPSGDPSRARAAARRAYSDRPDRGRGRRARRCARDPDPVDRSPAELGLHAHQAAFRHPAGRFPDPPDLAYADRPPARHGDRAVGSRDRAVAVFRRDGSGAAARLWRGDLDRAARVWRQHGSERAGRRHDPLFAGMGAGGIVFGRRRARCAGRRRSLRDGARNRAQRHLPPGAAQGSEIRSAARRDPVAPHHDGLQRGSRRRRENRTAPDDYAYRRAPRPRARRRLYVLQPRRRHARDAIGGRQQGHPRDAAKALRGQRRTRPN